VRGNRNIFANGTRHKTARRANHRMMARANSTRVPDALVQRDPMVVQNARFQAGWAALVQVLGQPRMSTIATALDLAI